jgi:hypothetical protein
MLVRLRQAADVMSNDELTAQRLELFPSTFPETFEVTD